jgi:hypothetical protein
VLFLNPPQRHRGHREIQIILNHKGTKKDKAYPPQRHREHREYLKIMVFLCVLKHLCGEKME